MRRRGRWVAIVAGALCLIVICLGWHPLCFWYRFESIGRNPQGLPEYRHRQTGIVMVRLPGGTFWMGAQGKDPKGRNLDLASHEDEGPVHEVTLRPFLIAKFEVTQAEWTTVMGSSPSQFTGDDTRPVENVSWNDFQGFEAKTGLMLPTEAQWEYACRATTTTPIAGTGKLDEMGWFNENSGETTHHVGKKSANGFGLLDVHGNVWEWCEDVYDERFYSRPDASGHDPVNNTGSGYRVYRGGSWGFDARFCRSAIRAWSGPSLSVVDLGFRASRPAP